MKERIDTQRVWRTVSEEGERVIRGKRGLVSQYPDGDLDVWVTHLRSSRTMERSGWKAKNHYDDGALFIRPFSDLDKAAKYIKAKRRRVMSPAQKAVLEAARAKSGIGKSKSASGP